MKNLYLFLIAFTLLSTKSNIICQNIASTNNINSFINENPNLEKSNFYIVKSEIEFENLQNSINTTESSVFEVLITASDFSLKQISHTDNNLVIIKQYTPLPEGSFIVLMNEDEVVKQIVHKAHMLLEPQFYIGIIQNKAVISKHTL